jgi:hypothetical protein
VNEPKGNTYSAAQLRAQAELVASNLDAMVEAGELEELTAGSLLRLGAKLQYLAEDYMDRADEAATAAEGAILLTAAAHALASASSVFKSTEPDRYQAEMMAEAARAQDTERAEAEPAHPDAGGFPAAASP